ncbi:MAG: DUF927 domain-containing protein, partial [Burkholderiaceae bacterium]
GILATTSGGSSSADSADWAPLQGRSVVLWPDNDEAGRKYAEAVTAKLQALGCPVEWIAPDVVASLPAKGDCVDWLAQHPDATAADVLKLPTEAVSTSPLQKSTGTAGTNRDTNNDVGLRVPVATGTNRDNRDKRPHFELSGADDTHRAPGVYWCDMDKDGNEAPPAWICSPLIVSAKTRDADNGEWGRLLEFFDADHKPHRWACPQSLHAGNGDELRAVLLREGLAITTNPKLRRMVGDYIQRAQPKVRARCVLRTGWHGDAFVLPRETWGDTEAEPVLFQAAALDGLALGQGGTLESWIEQVSAPCTGNSRLVLALSAAFAGPVLGLLGSEGGGIHLRGPTSCGKSTALHVAASAYGKPESYARNWRATDNGLEGVAAVHTDLLLVLDEIGQLEPRHAGQVAYMLANGQGKSRSRRDGSPRPAATWRVLFLSAGEVGLSELVTQDGGRMHGGQEVRVIDLPADTGRHGLFECIPDGVIPAAFSDRLKNAAATHYGHALPAFLHVLTQDPGTARNVLRQLRDSLADTITPKDAGGQVRRVAQRFALVAAAGELATVHKLTGWTTGEAEAAAKTCFAAWLDARGTVGSSDTAAMLAQVRAFLEANGEARFTPWDADEHAPRTINRAGYRKGSADGLTYYVEREAFKREVCKGFDPQAVARALKSAGALQSDKDGTTYKTRLPDGRSVRVYVITPALWGEA